LGSKQSQGLYLKGTASGPVCLAYEILSLVPPSPFSLVSFSFVSVSLCLFSSLSLSLSLSLSRASVLFVFCARRFDRFADGGHRGFNKQMHEFCKALQEAHNRLLLLLLILLLFILLHCVFVVEGKERKGK
jgi:hypothetical protein